MYMRMHCFPPKRGMGDVASSILGPVSAGVNAAIGAIGIWQNQLVLSHDADTATTQIVNGLEPLLRQNMNAYLQGPGTCADQALALSAFDTAFQWLQGPNACGKFGYGSAGNRCITDRAPGGKWDWSAMYRNPIANDPRASGCSAALASSNPDAALQSAVQNIFNVASGSNTQTTAGQFSGGSAAGAPIGSQISDFMSQSILGLPLPVWLVGLAVLFVAK